MIKSDYLFIEEGSKSTVELSDFLKYTGRGLRRSDKNIASYDGFKADLLQCNYKIKISGFKYKDQFNYIQDYLIYPQNIGETSGIDKLSLSKGELFTFVTSKNGIGKKQ